MLRRQKSWKANKRGGEKEEQERRKRQTEASYIYLRTESPLCQQVRGKRVITGGGLREENTMSFSGENPRFGRLRRGGHGRSEAKKQGRVDRRREGGRRLTIGG